MASRAIPSNGASRTDPSPSPAHWQMVGLAVAILMPSLATSSANAALPALSREFAVSFQAAQWIVLGFLIAVTSASLSVGRVADILGHRRLLIVGIAAFGAASLLCALAPSMSLLVIARISQGLAAAIVMALPLALVTGLMPQQRVGSAMGLLGAMSAVGTVLGPVVGGLLTAFAGPRAIFLINVPLGLVALALVHLFLPADQRANQDDRPGFDRAGTALLAITLVAYVAAASWGRGHFGLPNAAALSLALVTGLAFVLVERRAKWPLLRLDGFKKQLVRGLGANMAISAVMMATLVVGPFYLAGALNLSPAAAGLALSAGPAVAAIVGFPAGWLVDRFGSQRAASIGLLGLLAGSSSLALLVPAAGLLGYLLPIAAITGSYALFQAANNSSIMIGAEASERGVISAALSLSRNLGLITGAAVLGAIFAAGAAKGDLAAANAASIVTGTRLTFAAATVFTGAAWAMSRKARRTSQAQ